MTKQIPLTQGKSVLINDHWFDYLNQWPWHFSKGYAVRGIGTWPRTHKTIYMHRIIANTPDGMFTDHINRDTLDNRDENLRHCTKRQNQSNHKLRTDNRSGYNGVMLHNNKKHWQATITIKGVVTYLGIFLNVEEAARAYDHAAKEHFGEFATLNFPE